MWNLHSRCCNSTCSRQKGRQEDSKIKDRKAELRWSLLFGSQKRNCSTTLNVLLRHLAKWYHVTTPLPNNWLLGLSLGWCFCTERVYFRHSFVLGSALLRPTHVTNYHLQLLPRQLGIFYFWFYRFHHAASFSRKNTSVAPFLCHSVISLQLEDRSMTPRTQRWVWTYDPLC